jgi:hypothetical protein
VFGYVFDDVVWNVFKTRAVQPGKFALGLLLACRQTRSEAYLLPWSQGNFYFATDPTSPSSVLYWTHFMGQCTNSFQRSAITSIKMNSNNTANIIELATDLPLFCRGLQHFHLSVICLWASDCEKMGDTCKALVESLRSSYPGSEITVSIRHEDLSEFPLGHTGLGSSRHNRGRPPPRHRV